MSASPTSPEVEADVLLVGGGLASSLIALRLKRSRPALKIIMLERDATIGGQHTWSHFATDVSPQISAWLAPLIAHDWAGYDVRFPAHRRTLGTHYRAITSSRMHEVMSELLGEDAWLGVEAAKIEANAVRLSDGRRLTAPLVIDARGPRRSHSLVLGWQKFLGQEVRLTQPHGLTRPIIMDATVAQLDGYRFLYVLPFGPDRLLIEDTRYADGPALDVAQLARDIALYASEHGWGIAEIVREEVGVLPIALAGDINAYWEETPGPAADAGMRAALFHPTTGYSSPDAARQAELIAALPQLTTAAAREAIVSMSKTAWRHRAFYRLLNRMLFKAAEPTARYKVLERFYRLGQPLIERFYAGEATARDKLRILAGKPPVPIGRALGCLSEAPLLAERAASA
ncbi:MAG TPA: lycopene beta-cyclase CrtY [Caulobacteraceae bacterium]|jgi:lycopene beta-cyclase|nr:lycopene beta-cyclase CrtY [Caulobacteraceae bacterium]